MWMAEGGEKVINFTRLPPPPPLASFVYMMVESRVLSYVIHEFPPAGKKGGEKNGAVQFPSAPCLYGEG